MNVPMIVVGFDGSANARSALQAAVDLVADDGVVHVVTAYHVASPRETAEMMASMPEEYQDSYDPLDTRRGYLREAGAFLAARGIDHKAHFIGDNPASAILDVAEDVGAGMIVVGSRGLARGTRFIRGSVSSRIANLAKTSFMVVHDDDDDNDGSGDRGGMDPAE